MENKEEKKDRNTALIAKNESEKLRANEIFAATHLGKVWQCPVQSVTTGYGDQILCYHGFGIRF